MIAKHLFFGAFLFLLGAVFGVLTTEGEKKAGVVLWVAAIIMVMALGGLVASGC